MNLFQRLTAPFRNWNWLSGRKDHGDPAGGKWSLQSVDASTNACVLETYVHPSHVRVDPRTNELRLLDNRIALVREMLLKAKKNKKRWSHHASKLRQLQDQRANLS